VAISLRGAAVRKRILSISFNESIVKTRHYIFEQSRLSVCSSSPRDEEQRFGFDEVLVTQSADSVNG
jgi:hypothetical protein